MKGIDSIKERFKILKHDIAVKGSIAIIDYVDDLLYDLFVFKEDSTSRWNKVAWYAYEKLVVLKETAHEYAKKKDLEIKNTIENGMNLLFLSDDEPLFSSVQHIQDRLEDSKELPDNEEIEEEVGGKLKKRNDNVFGIWDEDDEAIYKRKISLKTIMEKTFWIIKKSVSDYSLQESINSNTNNDRTILHSVWETNQNQTLKYELKRLESRLYRYVENISKLGVWIDIENMFREVVLLCKMNDELDKEEDKIIWTRNHKLEQWFQSQLKSIIAHYEGQISEEK